MLLLFRLFNPLFDSDGCDFLGKMLGDNAKWGCFRQYTQGLNSSRPTGKTNIYSISFLFCFGILNGNNYLL